MANLEKDTGHYYRVLFEECMIKGSSVVVAYEIYNTASERDKEMQRERAWKDYQNNVNARPNALYDQLIGGIEKQGLQPNDALSQSEEGKIDSDSYPELRALQDELNNLEDLHNGITSRFYSIGTIESKTRVATIDNDLALIENGFDEEWVIDPIVIAGKAQLYAGEYNGEPITHEFYYTV